MLPLYRLEYGLHVAVSSGHIWRSGAGKYQSIVTMLERWNIICKDFLYMI